MFGHEVRREGHHDADRGFHRRIVEPGPQPGHRDADDKSDDDPADRCGGKREQALGKGGGDAGRGRERDPERGERGRVVEQTLPAEQRHDPSGQAEATSDGLRRHGVRWRDDGPEHHRGGQRQVRHGQIGDQPDDDRRHQRQPDGEQPDGPAIGADGLVRAVLGRGVQQRREDQEQHQIRVEHHLRHPRNPAHRQTHGDQDQGGRQPVASAQRRDRDCRDRDEQQLCTHSSNSNGQQ